jgi:hypothetical protein
MRVIGFVLSLLAALGCSVSGPTGADPNACQPACVSGDLCCPWSAQSCRPDAGCSTKSGFLCAEVDPGGACPPLQFSGIVDAG